MARVGLQARDAGEELVVGEPEIPAGIPGCHRKSLSHPVNFYACSLEVSLARSERAPPRR